MRGAQPDAECPRCHHRQPPSDGVLATCQKCGLSFPPKELQVRTRKPTSQPAPLAADELALAVEAPAALKVEETDGVVSYCWSDQATRGTVYTTVAVVVGLLLWTSDVELRKTLFHTVFLIGLAIYGVTLARRTPKITIDANHLLSTQGKLLLAEIERIDLDGNRIFAVGRFDKRQLIAAPKDPEIAAYVCNRLSRHITDRDKR